MNGICNSKAVIENHYLVLDVLHLAKHGISGLNLVKENHQSMRDKNYKYYTIRYRCMLLVNCEDGVLSMIFLSLNEYRPSQVAFEHCCSQPAFRSNSLLASYYPE